MSTSQALGNSPLSNDADQPVDQAAEERRRLRNRYGWMIRNINKDLFPKLSIGKCGLPLEDVAMGRRKADGRAALGGVSTCGSVHGCLRCAAVIRAARGEEVDYLGTQHLAIGRAVVFVTLTMPHRGSDSLDSLYGALRQAWRKLIQRKRYKRLRKRFKVFGQVRSTEFTAGANGWHPHLHILFFLDRQELSDDELDEFRARIYTAWSLVLDEELPGRTVHQVYGVDVRPVRDCEGVGEYVSKIKLEMTRSDLKLGRDSGSRTPWQLIIDFAETGDVDDRAKWRTYVMATHGKRVLGVSPALRERYGTLASVKKSDEQIAAESTDIDAELLIERELFYGLRRIPGRAMVAELLELFDASGVEAVVAAVAEQVDVVLEERPGELPRLRYRSVKAQRLVTAVGSRWGQRSADGDVQDRVRRAQRGWWRPRRTLEARPE